MDDLRSIMINLLVVLVDHNTSMLAHFVEDKCQRMKDTKVASVSKRSSTKTSQNGTYVLTIAVINVPNGNRQLGSLTKPSSRAICFLDP